MPLKPDDFARCVAFRCIQDVVHDEYAYCFENDIEKLEAIKRIVENAEIKIKEQSYDM